MPGPVPMVPLSVCLSVRSCGCFVGVLRALGVCLCCFLVCVVVRCVCCCCLFCLQAQRCWWARALYLRRRRGGGRLCCCLALAGRVRAVAGNAGRLLNGLSYWTQPLAVGPGPAELSLSVSVGVSVAFVPGHLFYLVQPSFAGELCSALHPEPIGRQVAQHRW